jgi:S1-C subfamily serine protease
MKQVSLYIIFLALGTAAGWAGGQYFAGEQGLFRGDRPNQENLQPESSEPLESNPANTETTALPPLFSRDQDDRSQPNNRNFIAEAVEQVGPAVVRIDAARSVNRRQFPGNFRSPFQPFPDTDPLPGPGRGQIPQGTGSGFILTSDGHIVTNAHVVEGADIVTVSLRDGREYEGEVVGIDPVTDLAAIKIEASDLPVVELGNSENLIPGQWAIAIGNPLGLDYTVTVGIISAIGRSSSQVGIPDRRVRFIQTDAAINPGNSGGPLLNDQGEVIGINTAIRADAQGLGFAIPIETAKRVMEQLFATGQVQHPYLGIQMIELSPEVRQRLQEQTNLNITVEEGILVVEVVPDSPADAAGFQQGDIITHIGGTRVTTPEEVQEAVEKSEIGEILTVDITRNNREEQIEVRPSPLPTEFMPQ